MGYCGTLDPAVTGVLPIAPRPRHPAAPLLPGEKTYQQHPAGSDHQHRRPRGRTLSSQPWPQLSAAELEEALDSFRGAIQQRSPQVSAVHVDGVWAHARARRGEQMSCLPAPSPFTGWNCSAGMPIRELALEVHCSSGTYIRSLARDWENGWAAGAACQLRRVQALGFQIDQASDLFDWPEEGPLS